MKRIFKNWKTSIAGLPVLVDGIVKLVTGDKGGIMEIITGIGLIFAKDGDKTGL